MDQDKHLRRIFKEKKLEELSRLPKDRIWSVLIDRFPLPANKRDEVRLRKEDWLYTEAPPQQELCHA